MNYFQIKPNLQAQKQTPLSYVSQYSGTTSIPLPLAQWPLLLLLFNRTLLLLILKISKSDNTLDEIMVREFLVRLRSIVNPQLPINNKTRLCATADDELQKCGLIFAKRYDAGSDGLTLEPRFSKWDLEDAFLESRGCATYVLSVLYSTCLSAMSHDLRGS